MVSTAPARTAGVYLLKFSTGRVYVGASLNLHKRVDEHARRLSQGQNHLPHLQAAYDAACGVYRVELRELPCEDSFELQVVERVMIRLMIQRLGRPNVVNLSADPKPIRDARPPDDASPIPLHPYE
jgi:hypothetical protein